MVFGPPAVGKMTVGRAVAARSDFRLFHNHAVIEPLLEVFDYGTPPFVRLHGRGSAARWWVGDANSVADLGKCVCGR